MPRLCLIPSTFDAAGWYRLLWPGGYMQSLGWESVVPPQQMRVLPNGERANVFEDIDRHLPSIDADVYCFQQPLDQGMVTVARYLQVIGKKIVVETDDDFRHIPAYHPARSLVAQRGNKHVARGMWWMEQMLQLADKVVVSTRAIGNSYRDVNPSVVGNLLHWPMWEPVRPVYETPFRKTRVGWMGGLEWRQADLDILKGWLPAWLERNPHVEFVAAGDQRVHDYLGIPSSQRVTAARIPFRNMDLPYITATMDVVLVPLADNRFNEGKSCLRGMECGAVGIPCIASPTREYRSWVGDGQVGYVAANTRQWTESLDELVHDTERRHAMGEKARGQAREWSLDRNGHVWDQLYRSVTGHDHHPDHPGPGEPPEGMSGVSGSADGPGDAPLDGGHERLWAADDPEPTRAAGDDAVAAPAR